MSDLTLDAIARVVKRGERRVDLSQREYALLDHALVVTINGLLMRLERALDDLRKFAADASHQLQTPLSVLKGTIEFIRRTPDSAQRATLLNDLDKEVNDMSAVVSDLQMLSVADADVQLSKPDGIEFLSLVRGGVGSRERPGFFSWTLIGEPRAMRPSHILCRNDGGPFCYTGGQEIYICTSGCSSARSCCYLP